jgi:hypothetical protein
MRQLVLVMGEASDLSLITESKLTTLDKRAIIWSLRMKMVGYLGSHAWQGCDRSQPVSLQYGFWGRIVQYTVMMLR